MVKHTLAKIDSEYLEQEEKPKDCELYPDRFKLELTGIDMLLLFGKDIQGGITRIMKRYPNSNNKYKVNLYNHEDLIRFLTFPDTSNLHVCAMIQKLQHMSLNGRRKLMILLLTESVSWFKKIRRNTIRRSCRVS